MDFSEQAVKVVTEYNIYKKGNCERINVLISSICALFDIARNVNLQEQDYIFLKYISSEIGLPQYYELLKKIKNIKDKERLTFADLMSYSKDASLCVDEKILLHKYQKEVYDSFESTKENRYFLSAPTSFGKTFLVLEIIKKLGYKNVVLIFPTIALLSENYMRIMEDRESNEFWANYSIHTLSNVEFGESNNLFIYTPERYMSFIDKYRDKKFDFVFIDEIYKIDNQFIIDTETVGENERDTAFRISLSDTCRKSQDILLAGPYIDFPRKNQNKSIYNFLNDNRFKVLDFNKIEIVNKSNLYVSEKKAYEIDNLSFTINNKNVKNKALKILQSSIEETNGTIFYCGTKVETERLAKYFIKNMEIDLPILSARLKIFISHLETHFGEDWVLVQALKHKIAIHHGLVPKYVQREIINLFNDGEIDCLISTTTITEGINTTAKNVVVMSDVKGRKTLKHFDAKNIAGRAGRFNSHYSGRVIAIDNHFLSILEADTDCLKHKNYDVESKKDDVDLDFSDNKYLSDKDICRKEEINKAVKDSGIPSDIINSFKSVSKLDKIEIYKSIKNLPADKLALIEKFCRGIIFSSFDWSGFDLICEIIKDRVENIELKNYLIHDTKLGHCVLTAKLYYYIKNGFFGIIRNELDYYERSKDTAIRNAAKLVYQTFRYQLTKYLGIFELMYRYHMSQVKNTSIDNILGLYNLIQLLEYGSVKEKAKVVNDYGVPHQIVKFYETEDKNIINKFDDYESLIFEKVKKIF